ncbi:hypothetical protein O7626_40190 [Micromonospora sp. WMMD1102]|uniref:hypothetical protein n=1 Tax=Micromonospora sp. WMMD1102 TaxID=3016105 RepID=UPI00241505B8|nr:hypothetical protein [Micromonospora sp. WMMD1102]MDG4792038.1 hypothetical protein [Micromonospora sp. WMMD1102]
MMISPSGRLTGVGVLLGGVAMRGIGAGAGFRCGSPTGTAVADRRTCVLTAAAFDFAIA